MEQIRNISDEFDFVLNIITIQAFIMFLISVVNFLSHFFLPQLLMYSKLIKLFNTLNLVIVGLMCLTVLVYYRFSDSANFCAG